jgi:hypothetical protein
MSKYQLGWHRVRVEQNARSTVWFEISAPDQTPLLHSSSAKWIAGTWAHREEPKDKITVFVKTLTGKVINIQIGQTRLWKSSGLLSKTKKVFLHRSNE